MGLLDEEHLLFALVSVKNVLNLLERDQQVSLGGDEDARRCDKIGQWLEVYLIDVEVSLREDDWLDVLIGYVQQYFG